MTNPLVLFHERLTAILQTKSINDVAFTVEHPRDLSHGDVATNVALLVKDRWPNGAEEITALLGDDPELIPVFSRFEAVVPGFINAWLTEDWIEESLEAAISSYTDYGRTDSNTDQKVLIEFTDPNPFKEFHIGHLMSNSIGEAMARLQEWTGATVERLCYQGDVGVHIAKAIWGMQQLAAVEELTLEKVAAWPLTDPIVFMGKAYAKGAAAYETEKAAIDAVNLAIYQRNDPTVTDWYDQGRRWSLEYFATIYDRLGTAFDRFYYESDTGKSGLEVVQKHLIAGTFVESDGAVIFPGENYGLHSRVFVNARGLPTYEAKELGLAVQKGEDYPDATSFVVVTGNEITDYFLVIQKALSLIQPELAEKLQHQPHGMLRLTSGKMSSRTGEVVVATALLDELQALALKRMDPADPIVADQVGMAAIKYAVLKQTVGKDIVYDPASSLAFEGNTGPYLQYTYARTVSVLMKAKTDVPDTADASTYEQNVSRLLYRFPQTVAAAAKEYAPNLVANFLFEIASRYNELYAAEKIIGGTRQRSLLEITKTVGLVLKNGLTILGIPAPDHL